MAFLDKFNVASGDTLATSTQQPNNVQSGLSLANPQTMQFSDVVESPGVTRNKRVKTFSGMPRSPKLEQLVKAHLGAKSDVGDEGVLTRYTAGTWQLNAQQQLRNKFGSEPDLESVQKLAHQLASDSYQQKGAG